MSRETLFDGLRVIDFANFIAGPSAATILADFGADVIKVEPPGIGDGARRTFRLENLPNSERDYVWDLLGRNKRSICLDLRREEGRDILMRLAQDADIAVTNMLPRQRKALDLDYERFHALNPRLIYALLSGHGDCGPEMNRPGFDATTFWARSGLADLVRPSVEAQPASLTAGAGDQSTALALFGAIMTALWRRERTGQGGRVSSTLIGNGIWSNGVYVQAALNGAEMVYREPYTRPRNAMTNFYPSADGRWLILSLIKSDEAWPTLLEVLDRQALASDPRFDTPQGRRDNATALAAELTQAFRAKPAADWRALFERAGLTVGMVAQPGDARDDAQMRAAGAIVEAAHLPGGLTIDSPLTIDGIEKRPPGPAPEKGAHSREILEAMGFSADEIDGFYNSGLIE
ncbi:CaiB/BaiF CoA transferase family protein [Nitratireductor alexandrii]|uniref:CaiB/BaiF CoA transferase family protein n=1 Tax=Nitratireductor alexandrii TaxID=2448161 RepID=UPI0013E01AD1|nr:CaiB/BaiF CoA-transferase family protein [Nitratireductor alexandrii]